MAGRGRPRKSERTEGSSANAPEGPESAEGDSLTLVEPEVLPAPEKAKKAYQRRSNPIGRLREDESGVNRQNLTFMDPDGLSRMQRALVTVVSENPNLSLGECYQKATGSKASMKACSANASITLRHPKVAAAMQKAMEVAAITPQYVMMGLKEELDLAQGRVPYPDGNRRRDSHTAVKVLELFGKYHRLWSQVEVNVDQSTTTNYIVWGDTRVEWKGKA